MDFLLEETPAYVEFCEEKLKERNSILLFDHA
jgi:hypothetical protein